MSHLSGYSVLSISKRHMYYLKIIYLQKTESWGILSKVEVASMTIPSGLREDCDRG